MNQIMLNIGKTLRRLRRTLEEFYIYATGKNHLLGFCIAGKQPILIKVRFSKTKRFWWYPGSFYTLPMQLIFRSEIVYDFTDRVALKNRSSRDIAYSDMERIFHGIEPVRSPKPKEVSKFLSNAQASNSL